ncbi:MAG: NAD(P)/FAD-dependent oxidoreductase, partial [Thermoplasmatota archaeon]
PEPNKENSDKIEKLKRKAASEGGKFFPIIQSHIGSDKAPAVIKSLKEELEERGVEFLVETEIRDPWIEDGKCKGVISTEGKEYRCKNTILAPGRVGIDWVQRLTEEYPLDASFGPIDIGVRVEVPSIIMDPIIEVNRDPKFHFYTKSYDDFVRTFCTNHRGFVVKEKYDGIIGVNGHSRKDLETENTNFAFLVRVQLTEPLEDTTKYGRAIASLATTIGGGRPIVQRMGDLKDGRRSTEERIARNPVQPTLDDVTPGDISMALPERAVIDIKEGLENLDEIIPGVDSSSTLLYAPEIKFYAKRLQIDDGFETSLSNLFAAGDGAGLSHDIVNAAATGILAGRGILDKL